MFPITENHEVIIHSPDHDKNVEELNLGQIENIIKVYINRYNFLKGKGKIFIFSNQSLLSGASLIHSHSQISVVPKDIPTNTLAFQPVANIVEQIGEFTSYCPNYSEWPYEVWVKLVKPVQLRQLDEAKFEDLNETQIQSLAKILQSSLIKLKKIHDGNPHYAKKPFGYNFYISVPIHPKGVQEQPWYLRIIPRFMERAGFELSTGIMVNSVEAKTAAEELKKI
jgi:UDPglucose--hexose-1-phosphate uridylyltransferase